MIRKISFAIILALVVVPNFAEAGFGVSPSKVIEDNLVPGSHYERTVYLVQGNPQKDLPIEINIESDRIKDWVKIEGGNEQTIPQGVQQFPIKLIVDVPEDAELDIYKSFVRISTIPEQGNTDGNIAIAIGGRIDLEMTVGDNVIKEYEILIIDILDIKESQDPQVEVKIKNTGNVAAAPSAASFELFNKFGTVRLGYSESEDFENVPSFSESAQVLSFPIDVRYAPGEYWGEVKFYDDEGKIIKELRTVFDVSEAGPLDAALLFLTDFSWLGIVAVVIIFGFVFLKLKKRGRVRRVREEE
jgi:hypothetical protein